jgi:hypothetical protein
MSMEVPRTSILTEGLGKFDEQVIACWCSRVLEGGSGSKWGTMVRPVKYSKRATRLESTVYLKLKFVRSLKESPASL